MAADAATQDKRKRLDPRLKILYLVATGVALFAISAPRVLFALLVLQIVLWFGSRYPASELRRPLRRVLPFAGLLVVTALLFGWMWPDPPASPGEALTAALRDSLVQSLRLLAIVLASSLVQRGRGGQDFIEGLTRLGLPLGLGVALETTLSLVTGVGGDRSRKEKGTGKGTGGGEGKGRRVLRQVLRGEIGFLVEGVQDGIQRARSRMEPFRERLGGARLDDLAVISAVALLSVAIRFLRIAPGLPIAPGHKGVVLIPLYCVAGALTRSPWGATQAGAVMGIIAFLMGDGKFGIFEILKFLTPGLVVDGLLPRLERRGEVGKLGYGALGLLAAVARFSTIVAVVLFVGAPPGLFAILAPIGITHAIFGALSGLVTGKLLRAIRATPLAQAPGADTPDHP